METTDTPSRAKIVQMAYDYGVEAAHHYWQLDPAEWDHAVEWVRKAETGGGPADYDLPGPFDELPADLNTEGWSWTDLWYYEQAWKHGYFGETTKLCRNLIATYRDNHER
jgi:hypothetical protein